jgi:hypothetical protein
MDLTMARLCQNRTDSVMLFHREIICGAKVARIAAASAPML